MTTTLHYFKWAMLVTVLGLIGAFWLGLRYDGTVAGALSFLLVGCVLAVLEISLSFDNAIVNANKLKTMDPVWQRRFLTWGILIAVFGMRIVFPLAVVAVAAWVGPIEAVRIAATDPREYARLMTDSHLSISAFGGTFLMLVALSFFVDREKEVDWLPRIESRMRRAGAIRGMSYGLVLLVVLAFGLVHEGQDRETFFLSAAFGAAVFAAVELLARVLDARQAARDAARAGGFGAFLYLEVLDASFSFDGVIGAFALTQNLFLIAIGLGVGAMYVRSMTIMLVEKRTLAEFRFLEHGAFYSILALSVIMFLQGHLHIPEALTGLIGAVIIGLSFAASLRDRRVRAGEL